MQHLGDITKISGYHAPVVDCIIGGSPCQDLSVAGKRAGLAGERSGLFMEQIRIVKEMRQRERDIGRSGQSVRPRYMVWENVCGALSSPGKGHAGEDFAAVLEETIRIAEPEAPDIPVPEKGWPTSGCIMGEGWSVAWRVLDAQFWGVPQRRRRIALVADFGGQSAPEILFERKGLRRDFAPGRAPWQGIAADAEGSAGAHDREGESNCKGGLNAIGCDLYNLKTTGDKAVSLTTAWNSTGSGPTVAVSIALESGIFCTEQSAKIRGIDYEEERAPTLRAGVNPASNCMHDPMAICYGVDARNATEYIEITGGVQSSAAHNLNSNNTIRLNNVVRRLTPLECERLQGFPDGWTDIGEWVDSKGKKHKEADSPRYKALGNSIALPPWKWVLKRLCACYERDATMASLFDGIGGFPLIWEQLNGKGSCLWASEIEEFPIAVTKLRFGGD